MAEIIRVKALNGVWHQLGLIADPHVPPESITASANEWGYDQLTCTLQRDPTEDGVDLTAWTDAELEVDGETTWEGRIKEAPKQGGATPSVSVIAEGWQYHLDDDLYEQTYVHSAISEFQDMRTMIDANLGVCTQAGNISSDERGNSVIGWQKGAALVNGVDTVGLILDMGQVVRAKTWVVRFDHSAPVAGIAQFVMRGSENDNPFTGLSETLATVDLSATTAPMGGNFSTGTWRFLSIFLVANGTFTLATDVWLKFITSVVTTDTAYQSGGVSTLVAWMPIEDALNKATVLLSSDRSQIATTSFVIPSLDFRNTPRTPRDVLGDVNNLHNYRLQIGPDRVPIFQPLPTSPVAVVNTSDAGVDWQDASSGSGDNIINRVIVTGNTGAGMPVREEKYASSLPGVPLLPAVGLSFPNPSMDTVLTGWTKDFGNAIARTTVAGEFDTSPGALKLTQLASESGRARTTLSGTFKAGINYVFTFRYKAAFTSAQSLAVFLWSSGTIIGGTFGLPIVGAWTTYTMSWTPSIDVVNPDFTVEIGNSGTSTGNLFLDTFAILIGQPTLPDRRGFKRTQVLQVGSPLDPATAQQLATLYLQAHSTTPFKGSCTISSPHAAQDPKSGRPIPPREFTRYTMQILRFGDLVNPDDGGFGRDGIIRDANYQNGTVSLTIDNSNRNLEALLQRMAVVQGG